MHSSGEDDEGDQLMSDDDDISESQEYPDHSHADEGEFEKDLKTKSDIADTPERKLLDRIVTRLEKIRDGLPLNEDIQENKKKRKRNEIENLTPSSPQQQDEVPSATLPQVEKGKMNKKADAKARRSSMVTKRAQLLAKFKPEDVVVIADFKEDQSAVSSGETTLSSGTYMLIPDDETDSSASVRKFSAWSNGKRAGNVTLPSLSDEVYSAMQVASEREILKMTLKLTSGEDSTAQIEVAVHQSCFVDREGTCGAIADITALRTLFQWAYPKSKLSERGPSKADHFSPQSLYSAIKPHIIEMMNSFNEEEVQQVQHPSLKSRLRQYQSRAVVWMKQREGGFSEVSHLNALETELKCYWRGYREKKGKRRFFYNEFSGALSWGYPDLGDYDVNGGILADEMGLGKTLEVVALVLNRPRPGFEPSAPPNPMDIEVKEEKGVDLELGHLEDVEEAVVKLPQSKRPKPTKKRTRSIGDDESESEHYRPLKKQRNQSDSKEPNDMDSKQRPTTLAADQYIDVLNDGWKSSSESADSVDVENGAEGGEASEEVLCYCGGDYGFCEDDNDNITFVYCESCRTWQHERCVGLAKRERRGKYECPTCIEAKGLRVDIGATLIVCPDSILLQWKNEIVKHVRPGHLKVLVYEGVKNIDPRKTNVICRPSQLAQYDIILTTYSTLNGDIYHTDNLKARGTQNRRYRYLPTPLRLVNWWRICMDESQMIGQGSTGAAQMLNQLSSENRWAVSGTPIQRGLEDVYGLMLFLGVSPYENRQWWDRALQEPFYCGAAEPRQRLEAALQRLMWRNTKDSVELELPPMEEKIAELEFTEVEKYLYKKRHREISDEMSALIHRYSGDEHTAPPEQLKKIVGSLLSLRQLCCHPQLGRNTGFASLARSTMTMEELLDQLVEKARVECEEDQRLLISHQNALAALSIITENYDKAIEIYREILKEKEIEVDVLQRIHATHNLAFALQHKAKAPAAVDAMDIDDQPGAPLVPDTNVDITVLHASEKELGEEFLTKRINPILVKRGEVESMGEQIAKDNRDKHLLDGNTWWSQVIGDLIDQNNTNFVSSLKATLTDRLDTNAVQQSASIVDRFRGLDGLRATILGELGKINTARNKAIKAVDTNCRAELYDAIKVAKVLNCRKCKLKEKGELCVFCETDDIMETYERALYLARWKYAGEKMSYTNAIAEVEIILQSLSRLPLVQDDKELRSMAQAHLKTFESMKKEIVALRDIVVNARYLAFGQDELAQCNTRIRLRFEGEEVPPEHEHFKIFSYEVPTFVRRHETEMTVSLTQFRHNLSQYHYLQKLSQDKDRIRGTAQESTECPICKEDLGGEIVVFSCGHEICPGCMSLMLDSNRHRSTVDCPICRTKMNSSEVSRVVRGPKPQRLDGEALPTIVKGSWGTKIEAVVMKIMQILARDPEAKVLLFSQWAEILMVICQALRENGVAYINLEGSSKKMQTQIDQFRKTRAERVLCLTLHRGANGLNLTEANHVVLVEPSFNPASEAQAIGRVHRIGQEKPTFVHRFIVKSSVESKVFHLGRSRVQSSQLSAGFGTKVREDEMLGLKDLDSLINDAKKLDETEDLAATLFKDYWEEQVLVNQRPMTRENALAIISRNVRLLRGQPSTEQGGVEAREERVEWKGRQLAPQVVDELKQLRKADSNQ